MMGGNKKKSIKELERRKKEIYGRKRIEKS